MAALHRVAGARRAGRAGRREGAAPPHRPATLRDELAELTALSVGYFGSAEGREGRGRVPRETRPHPGCRPPERHRPPGDATESLPPDAVVTPLDWCERRRRLRRPERPSPTTAESDIAAGRSIVVLRGRRRARCCRRLRRHPAVAPGHRFPGSSRRTAPRPRTATRHLSLDQMANAATIAAVGIRRDVPDRAIDGGAGDRAAGVEAAQPRRRRPRLGRPVPAAARRRAGAPRRRSPIPRYAAGEVLLGAAAGQRLADA